MAIAVASDRVRVRDIKQIANYALVEWDDNIAISDAPRASIGRSTPNGSRLSIWRR